MLPNNEGNGSKPPSQPVSEAILTGELRVLPMITKENIIGFASTFDSGQKLASAVKKLTIDLEKEQPVFVKWVLTAMSTAFEATHGSVGDGETVEDPFTLGAEFTCAMLYGMLKSQFAHEIPEEAFDLIKTLSDEG